MKTIFYRISYHRDPETPIQIYGHTSTSLPQTLAELVAFGVTSVKIDFLTEEEIKADINNPFPL